MQKYHLLLKVLIIVVCCAVALYILCTYINSRTLIDAVEGDDYKKAEQALSRGAWVDMPKFIFGNPNIQNRNPTALIIACRNGNEEIMTLLLANGADINKADKWTGETPLLAALHGTKQNRFRLALSLIEKGADITTSISSRSVFSETLVVMNVDTAQTIYEGFLLFQYLMRHSVSMTVDNENTNALTYAACYNNLQVVTYLIEGGYFDINSAGKNGNTALMEAARKNNLDIVSFLLQHGADTTRVNEENQTVYDIATESGHTGVIALIEQQSLYQ